MLGRVGGWQVGAVSMQTDDVSAAAAPSTNFSVVRINRDILSRSRVGLIATGRNPSGADSTLATYSAGADAQFNVRSDITINTYWATTTNTGRSGDKSSYKSAFDWNADRYGLNLEHLFVGDGFNPGVGFMRRSAFRRSYVQARFSPRPAGMPLVRKFTYQTSADYITAATGGVQSEEYQGSFITEFTSGDFMNAEVTQSFEQLDAAFEVARGVNVPVGGYRYTQGKASYTLGPQRPVSGTVTFTRGGFYGGTLTEASWRGRLEFTSQLYAEPTVSFNRVTGPYGSGENNLYGSRLTYTVTPRMFAAALVQYQTRSASMSTNLRLRWEYQPGSELFVVYSDGRTTDGPQFSTLENRSIVIKLTKLFRW